MDDASLDIGGKATVVGAIIGLILGVTVWQDELLVVVIVFAFYGAVLGAAGGLVAAALTRRR